LVLRDNDMRSVAEYLETAAEFDDLARLTSEGESRRESGMLFHQRNKKVVAVGTRSRGFGFIRKLEIERAMTLTVLCRELQIDFSGEAPPVAGKLSSCCISAKALTWRVLSFQLNQSCHLAPLYSLKCMHNVASVEDGYQALDRSLRATRSRRNVFPEDESGVLNGPNENVLIWIVHKGVHKVLRCLLDYSSFQLNAITLDSGPLSKLSE